MLSDNENCKFLSILVCKIENTELNIKTAVIFERMEIFQRKFEGVLENHSPVNSDNLVKKSQLVAKKLFHVWWDIFLAHPVYIFIAFVKV